MQQLLRAPIGVRLWETRGRKGPELITGWRNADTTRE